MIDIKVDGVDNLIRLLKDAERGLNNLSEPMQKGALYLERETKLNFARQSTPDGAAWAGLAPSTLAQKTSGAILRQSGALAGSIQVVSVSATEAVIASLGVLYAIFHQMGTSKMPAREFIGIAERHVSRVEEIFNQYIERLLA